MEKGCILLSLSAAKLSAVSLNHLLSENCNKSNLHNPYSVKELHIREYHTSKSSATVLNT